MTVSNSPCDGASAAIVLCSDAGEFRRLVCFAEDFARRRALPDAERARLLIILEELFTNAVRYGYPGGARPGRIEVALAATPGRIQIDFSDDGRAFDPLVRGAAACELPLAEREPGGLGLEIVHALVDEARYRRERERNHLTLVRWFPAAT